MMNIAEILLTWTWRYTTFIELSLAMYVGKALFKTL